MYYLLVFAPFWISERKENNFYFLYHKHIFKKTKKHCTNHLKLTFHSVGGPGMSLALVPQYCRARWRHSVPNSRSYSVHCGRFGKEREVERETVAGDERGHPSFWIQTEGLSRFSSILNTEHRPVWIWKSGTIQPLLDILLNVSGVSWSDSVVSTVVAAVTVNYHTMWMWQSSPHSNTSLFHLWFLDTSKGSKKHFYLNYLPTFTLLSDINTCKGQVKGDRWTANGTETNDCARQQLLKRHLEMVWSCQTHPGAQ